MWQKIKNKYHLIVAFLSSFRFGFPSKNLVVIGITGTSGKTTTAHMMYEILKEAHYKVSLFSTIKAVIGGQEYDTGFHVTTPDAYTLQRYLRMAKERGDTHVVLEISSHGLDQKRAAFIHFYIGILTTLAHEHLDYHKTFKNYARAKFTLLHQADYAILPVEEIPKTVQKSVRYEELRGKITTFGIKEGDINAAELGLHMKMPGDFNKKNALAAWAAAKIIGVPKESVLKTLNNFNGLPGRFEEIPTKKDFRVIIDFAHKPDALEAVLHVVEEQVSKNGRIIIMYGCASQRDVLKRPLMGAISAKLADITVLTDEDPRFEDPTNIINEIAKGCIEAGASEVSITDQTKLNEKKHIFYKISDRLLAINFIITKLARKGDIILLCGKGHETSISYNGVEKPWNERKAAEKALEKVKN